MSSILEYASMVWEDIGSPTSPSVQVISGWAKSNIGTLNILLNEEFSTSGDDFSPSICPEASGIFSEVYKVKYYESQIRDSINGVLINGGIMNGWVELREGDTSIRRTNPADLARTYRGLKKDAKEALDSLIQDYKSNQSDPSQVVGDELY